MIILVGSAADPQIMFDRVPKDCDFICHHKDYQEFIKTNRKYLKSYCPINSNHMVAVGLDDKIFEFEIAWEGSSAAQLLDIIFKNNKVHKLSNNKTKIMSPFFVYDYVAHDCGNIDKDVLYTLKMSHRFRKNTPHFLKTMNDIHAFRKAGAVIPDYLKDWLVIREKETYDYSHPVLNKSKDSFFSGDGVNYIYDHDSIHRAVALLNQPAYLYYKHEDKDVLCSKDKFDSQSHFVKLAGVLEEALVLALERSQIPNDFSVPVDVSFKQALEKVCTSITSGWFREFAWENYRNVLTLYKAYQANVCYHERFLRAKAMGLILPYSGEKYA